MDHEELMEFILDHYKHPRHKGVIEDAEVVQEGGNAGCGDIIKVYLDTDDKGAISRVSFDGDGCMVSQAGTSIMLEMAEGKTTEEIEKMTPDVIAEVLGRRLVTTRPNCAYLGFNTLKNAVKAIKTKKLSDTVNNHRAAT
jgi:nitrogen fixation NifU-like protein